jgi:hypothetical protein
VPVFYILIEDLRDFVNQISRRLFGSERSAVDPEAKPLGG